MPIISSQDAPTFDIPGVRFIGLAAPSRGATENAVWRVVMQPGTPANVHRLSREEVLVAVSGSARVSIAGVESELTAGSAVIVPPDTDFALYNP
ncbi:MAG: cupin domain-containing protein, partial [Myxococcales bacterium]|nr:cupin domain-containing protein [Myxococcales bacterium]